MNSGEGAIAISENYHTFAVAKAKAWIDLTACNHTKKC